MNLTNLNGTFCVIKHQESKSDMFLQRISLIQNRLHRAAFLFDMWAGGPLLTSTERVVVLGCWTLLIFMCVASVYTTWNS